MASSVNFSATPLSRNRWLFRVYCHGQELTDGGRHNGLLQLLDGRPILQRWDACLPQHRSLVKQVMLHACQEWGLAGTR